MGTSGCVHLPVQLKKHLFNLHPHLIVPWRVQIHTTAYAGRHISNEVDQTDLGRCNELDLTHKTKTQERGYLNKLW